MSRPHRLFARDRETVEEAFAGDVIGLSNPGIYTIGDTLSGGESFSYPPIPRFQPEVFARLRNVSIEKYKQFNKGLEQLLQEGVVQVLYGVDSTRHEPILCAVGQLQFEVVASRLQAEYNVEASIEMMSSSVAAWIEGDEEEIRAAHWPMQSIRTRDDHDRWVILFETPWQLNYARKELKHLRFVDIAGNPFPEA
jgi:peptide chain release factor 3